MESYSCPRVDVGIIAFGESSYWTEAKYPFEGRAQGPHAER